MDSDTGFISGRTAITLDGLIADGQEEHNNMVDRLMVGNLTSLEGISTKPVGVTADGKVILEMRGWAGDIDQYMGEDQRAEYEAGRVSRAQD
ncbi:hypothetical protein [Arthrobacter sp. A2-55]|uniref:hypothetical protein n=1 Tax=Arthrobacter sp. A2-55 TaxID=2897337 RepID=UPI0021CDD602|nr:hypothetical protein [Arthrobacter sp. A2-55]MCU6479016.1 hypothetical protein [Arthrobacter sp. A2-55]